MNVLDSTAREDEVLESLVRRAQRGDSDALEEVISTTFRLVRKIAAPLLPACAIDDAVQETYLIVVQKLHYLQNPAAFRSWLSRIALHICYAWRKKSKPTEPLEETHATSDLGPSDRRLRLQAALEQLPQNDRDILILREYLGLSYEELADVLTLAEGTVRSRLFNARKKLKALLETGDVS